MRKVLRAEDFPPLTPPGWGSIEETERRRRISLSVLTYAYEVRDTPILSDAEWDWAAQRIQPHITTGHPLLDEFFLFVFTPITGMWIHQHPELDGIQRVYERYMTVVRPPIWRERLVTKW